MACIRFFADTKCDLSQCRIEIFDLIADWFQVSEQMQQDAVWELQELNETFLEEIEELRVVHIRLSTTMHLCFM